MTGPLAGQTYTQVMLPMGAQNDQWIANIASYVRNEFGNTSGFIAPADVARVRAATADRKTMWTYPELEVTLPRLLPVDPTWKATASHNAERAASGLTLAAWTTGIPQAPDMWFQVELPQPAMMTEVQFDAGAPGGGGRGRGGRGAPPPRDEARRPEPARRQQRRRPRLVREPVQAPPARRRSAAPRPAAAAAVAGLWQLPDRLQGAAVDRRQDVERARRPGRGLAGDHRRHVPSGAGEVRARDPDRHGRERARVVGAELPGLCERGRGGALTPLRVYGGDEGNGFDTKTRRHRRRRRTGRAARSAGSKWTKEQAKFKAPDEFRSALTLPALVRCHWPAIQPATRPVCWSTHLDGLRSVSVTLRFFVLNPLTPSPP